MMTRSESAIKPNKLGKRARTIISNTAVYSTLTIWSVFVLIPFFWMI